MIDTAAIRNKLMHLAVSGNLVEHDIEDGNASELVEKISHEINGSSRREVAIDEIPYEIPENWTWCRLSDIGSTNIGLTYHPEDVVIDGIPVLRSNNIKNNKLIFDDLIKVNCEIREKQYIGENDILICARNGSKALVGKCAIYSGELGLTSFGAFMAVYRTQCFEYVYYYFQTKVFRRYFENENNKQINQVTQSILKDAIIPLPPIKEQKRIVEKINKVFELLDVIDEMQQQYSSDLEVLKSKIIDAGIQGKLTQQLPEDGTAEELLEQIRAKKDQMIKDGLIPKESKSQKIIDEDKKFETPKNWAYARVQDVATYITDYVANGSFATLKANTTTYKEPNYAVFVRTLDLGAEFKNDLSYIDESSYEFLKKSKLFGGELILPNIGASIGKAFIMPDLGMPMSLAPNSVMVKFENDIMNKYFYYVFQSSYGKGILMNIQGGAATPKFSKTDLRKMIVMIPPLAEQERIVNKIEEIFSLIK